MTLQEVKALLPNMNNDDFLEAILPLVLDWIEDYCNQDFLIPNPGYTEGGVEPEHIKSYPGGVKIFVAKACEMHYAEAGVQSETLGDYSVTRSNITTDYPDNMKKLLIPYRKMRWH